MNIELLMHGVPNGFDMSGDPNEKSYLNKFYLGENRPSVYMSVEIRQKDGKPYTYYNYIRCNNIMDADGRSGSYCGLTLRIDEYWKDAVSVYNILNIAFAKYFIGSLVRQDGSNYRYCVHSFNECKPQYEKLKEAIKQFITSFAKSKDFIAQLGDISKKAEGVPEFHLLECTLENIWETIRKYGEVYISHQFVTQRELMANVSYEKKLKGLEHSKEVEINTLSEEIKALKSEVMRLKGEVENEKTANLKLSQQYKKKEEEVRHSKKCQEVDQVVQQIKDPITELAELIAMSSPKKTNKETENDTKHVSWWSTHLPLVNTLLTLALIILFFLFNVIGKGKNDTTQEVIHPETITVRDTIYVEKEVYRETSDAVTTVRIDVKEYSGSGPLKVGELYTVKLIGEANGQWKVSGAELIGSKYHKQIQIKATAPGVVSLSYNENGKTLQHRQFNAVSNN